MRLAITLIIVVLSVVFAVQNADVVTLSVFFWRMEASLAVIIALCFVIGALIAALALTPQLYRRRADERRLRRQLDELNGRESSAGQRDAPDDEPNDALPVASLRTPPQPHS